MEGGEEQWGLGRVGKEELGSKGWEVRVESKGWKAGRSSGDWEWKESKGWEVRVGR